MSDTSRCERDGVVNDGRVLFVTKGSDIERKYRGAWWSRSCTWFVVSATDFFSFGFWSEPSEPIECLEEDARNTTKDYLFLSVSRCNWLNMLCSVFASSVYIYIHSLSLSLSLQKHFFKALLTQSLKNARLGGVESRQGEVFLPTFVSSLSRAHGRVYVCTWGTCTWTYIVSRCVCVGRGECHGWRKKFTPETFIYLTLFPLLLLVLFKRCKFLLLFFCLCEFFPVLLPSYYTL